MTVWLIFAIMTAAAIFAVLVPLARSREAATRASGSDLAVYKDQLAEIGRDRQAGLIGELEAEAARIEVSRRLIAAADQARPAPDSSLRRRRITAIAAIVVVPLVAAGIYGSRGQPDYPGQPLAGRDRQTPAERDLATLIGRVEAHLAANPEDGRGWEILAPIYVRLGRGADAIKARANALRLLGATADREADLAEARVLAAQGQVTAEAKAGFQRAMALEPNHPKASYFAGLAAEQDGKPDDARAVWTRLAEAAPPGAPWLGTIQGEIVRLGGTPPPAPATPTASDIRGMVDGLAARLAADGSDFDGWLRLVRSYAVLGDTPKARQAASDARRHFLAEAEKLTRLDALVRELGLGG
ncbi:c-type cytochrome biogenesis protein CcmI [Phreatobacter stygius]|uniref:C-type cytochrome biogenesis protein CcmI n=1 Tax=Phreatobacter stygius TaxID=1940610 RepID=A0A4D7B817_9HYPH|nr:c-type cytochrome biogenesis protein CcmI [Phreatobacter stygius]QCI66550.1 c-type cytochrome biogenesis protein CcmI [Phreatobacter stygius]